MVSIYQEKTRREQININKAPIYIFFECLLPSCYYYYPPPHPTPFYSLILFISLLRSLFPRSAFGEQRYLKGCLSFYGQQLGVVFSPLIIWFLGSYHWLIGVACAGVMRKLWIIFYSIVSLFMPCGVKFF